MKNFDLTKALIIVCIALLVAHFFRSNGSDEVIEILNDENKKLELKIDSLNNNIPKYLNAIRSIDSSKTIIKNNYNYEILSLDSLITDSSIVNRIRLQLQRLRANEVNGSGSTK